MTPQAYEAAILAEVSWRLSLSNSVDELICIALTIRNHVIVKPGRIATYKSFPEACADFLKAYPAREAPQVNEMALIAPMGLLSVIEKIYSCEYADITATQTTPGARTFARIASLEEKDWRYQLVRSSMLCGTFGSQQFFS